MNKQSYIRPLFARILLVLLLLLTAACSNSAQTATGNKKTAPSGNAQASSPQQSSNQPSSSSQPSSNQQSSNQQSSNQQSSNQPPVKTDKPYINRLLPEAQRIEQEYGVPVATTLAIAIHETGWGKYEIGQNNHFGLRCASDDCTTLNKNGAAISYETCPDEAECFNMFAESVTELAKGKPSDLRVIYKNGYATSPQWVSKVRRIRRQVKKTLEAAGYQA